MEKAASNATPVYYLKTVFLKSVSEVVQFSVLRYLRFLLIFNLILVSIKMNKLVYFIVLDNIIDQFAITTLQCASSSYKDLKILLIKDVAYFIFILSKSQCWPEEQLVVCWRPLEMPK